jgi:hypothetical protein
MSHHVYVFDHCAPSRPSTLAIRQILRDSFVLNSVRFDYVVNLILRSRSLCIHRRSHMPNEIFENYSNYINVKI